MHAIHSHASHPMHQMRQHKNKYNAPMHQCQCNEKHCYTNAMTVSIISRHEMHTTNNTIILLYSLGKCINQSIKPRFFCVRKLKEILTHQSQSIKSGLDLYRNQIIANISIKAHVCVQNNQFKFAQTQWRSPQSTEI